MKLLLTIVLAVGLSTNTFAQDWLTNLDQAKTIATKQNKNIILVFSGSDWCAPCIKLEKEIWESSDFQKEAEKNWVLLKADFPRRKANKLSKEQTKENEKIADLYNTSGYFPLVVVLDSKGKILGKTGYKEFPPTEYIKHLHSFE